MTKKSIMTIILLLVFSIFSGCSTGTPVKGNSDSVENQQLARVEIYSANEQTLLGIIEDKEALEKFNENTSFTEQVDDMDDDDMDQQAEIQKKLEQYEPQYIFISYKTPVAKNNDGDLEKVLEFTVYKDTNIIKEQISPDNVKNISVPSEYLTFYFETSDEVTKYLYSLV